MSFSAHSIWKVKQAALASWTLQLLPAGELGTVMAAAMRAPHALAAVGPELLAEALIWKQLFSWTFVGAGSLWGRWMGAGTHRGHDCRWFLTLPKRLPWIWSW